MGRVRILVKDKLKILSYFHGCNNVKAAAKQFLTATSNIQPCQIRKWRKEKNLLQKKNEEYHKYFSLCSGDNNENQDLEKMIYTSIVQQQQNELAVSTAPIKAKALSVDPGFKGRDPEKLTYWVYRFLSR